MFRWPALKLSTILLICLLSVLCICRVSLAADKWELLVGGKSLGGVPVISHNGVYLVAIDIASELLGVTADEKGDTLLIRGTGGNLQIFPGSAAAVSKGEIIPIPHEVIRSEGHWWVEPDASLSLLGRVSDSNDPGGRLSWKGEGYLPPKTGSSLIPPASSAGSSSGQVLSPAASAAMVTVRSIRWGRQDFGIRVVIDLSAPAPVQIDINKNNVTVSIPGILARGTPGSYSPYPAEVRAGVTQFGNRAVIGFTHNSSGVKHFTLESPFRQVIDFYNPSSLSAGPAVPLPSVSPSAEISAPAESPQASLPQVSKGGTPAGKDTAGRANTIVLDPGHGGKDPGAVANGLKEKDINLKVAMMMSSILKNKGFKVKMTRSTDVYLRLNERTNIAVREDADVFVSLHCNALPKGRTAQGVEIYLMALPTDKHAMELALIENRELVNGGLEKDEASDKRTRTLLKILGDMQQNAKIQESTSFAEILFRTGESRKLPMRRVAQAPFFVLRGAAMPSVLVEMGFLTNSSEAAKLKSPNYQKQMAEALSAGIVEFLQISDYN